MALMLSEVHKLSTEAAARGEYETAYHLLMAALHIADHAKDVGALDRITQLAKEQGAAVERLQPPHPLSRAHAQMRGQTSLYESLLAHIEAVRLRLHSDQVRRRHPEERPAQRRMRAIASSTAQTAAVSSLP